MPAAARRDNRSATYPSTDTDNRLTNTDPMWDGSQARQATWFNEKLKRAEADFEFYQLCQSTTVTMSKSGAIAVFSPEHALEHAQGTNKGTMRAPSNRKREDLLARSLAKATAATASPTPAGAQGGTPTPTSVPVPTATTYAAATARSNPAFVSRAADRCPVLTTIRPGVGPCAVLPFGCFPTWPPTPGCACGDTTSSPPISKVSYSRARRCTVSHPQALSVRVPTVATRFVAS